MKNIIALLAFTLTIMSCEKIELYDENNNIEAEIVELEYFKMVEMPEYPGDVDYDSYDKLPLNPNTGKSNEVIAFDPKKGFPDNYNIEDYFTNSHLNKPYVKIFVVNDDFETLDARLEFNRSYSGRIYLKKGYNYVGITKGDDEYHAIGTINQPFKIVDVNIKGEIIHSQLIHPANKIFWLRWGNENNNPGERGFVKEINENVTQTGTRQVFMHGNKIPYHTITFIERGLLPDLSHRIWTMRIWYDQLSISYTRVFDRYYNHSSVFSFMSKHPNGYFLPDTTIKHGTRPDGFPNTSTPYHPYKDFFSNDVTDQTWEIYDGYTLKYTNEDPIVLPKHEVQEMYGYLFGKTPPIR